MSDRVKRIEEMTTMATALLDHDAKVEEAETEFEALRSEWEAESAVPAPKVPDHLTRVLAERWAVQNGR